MTNDRWYLGVLGLVAACGGTTTSTDDAGALDAADESDASIVEDARPLDGAAESSDAGSASDATPSGDATPSSDAALEGDAGSLRAIEHATITPFVDDCVAAPTGLGSYGSVTAYDRYELANPSWVGTEPLPVQVLVPTSSAATRPVIFYGHPFGGSDWTRVRATLEHLVSQDLVVVFVPYTTTESTVCERYDTLWGGMTTAVEALGALAHMDTSRFGVIGHSFGGGAAPWLAHEAVVEEGWGASGAFVFAMAPWFTHRMETSDWSELPSSMRHLLMVFGDDTTNDHRIAIADQWDPWPGLREYVRLDSTTHGACTHLANHVTPATGGESRETVVLDGLDTWGVWRRADALVACTLRGDASACPLVSGGAGATDMGTWIDDGTPVPPAVVSDPPMPVAPASDYTFTLARRGLFPCSGRGGT